MAEKRPGLGHAIHPHRKTGDGNVMVLRLKKEDAEPTGVQWCDETAIGEGGDLGALAHDHADPVLTREFADATILPPAMVDMNAEEIMNKGKHATKDDVQREPKPLQHRHRHGELEHHDLNQQ